jgi:hypothetical protein
MIEPVDDMPPGTIGFRATGNVTRDEYRDVLLPAMRQAAEAGETGLTLGLGHLSAWKRTALVTDVEWIAKAAHMLAWMTPGELLVRALDGLDEAKRWVAE